MDPVQDAITHAIDAAEAETNKAAADAAAAAEAGGDDDKGAGGAGGDGTGAGEGAGADELPAEVTTALEKEPADLSDEETALIVENKDKLTAEQVTALTEAGVLEAEVVDDKPVKGEGAKTEPDKLHEVPADDSDLVLEVEDAEGNKVTIAKISDLPSDFIYKDSRQPLEILEGLGELKDKRAERAKLRADNEVLADSNDTRTRVAELWNGEFAALQQEGVLPAGKTDWEKGEYGNAKIKEAAEGLFTFMTEENQRREKDGRPYVVSLRDVATLKAAADAKSGADKGNKGKTAEEIAAEKKAKATKDEKARKIAAGNSDNSAPEADDKPTYVAGSGQSIGDITEQMINEMGAK